MKRCVLGLLALLVLPVAGASAGTYDVVACNAPGAGGVNAAWAFETFNASGRAAPARARSRRCPLSPTSQRGPPSPRPPPRRPSAPTAAPPGSSARRPRRRSSASRCGATSPPRRGRRSRDRADRERLLDALARGGDTIAGRMVLGGETCPGNTPTAPDTVWCRRGNAAFPARHERQLRHQRARRQLGRPVRRPVARLALLHRRRRVAERLPVPAGRDRDRRRPGLPGRRLGPARGRHPAHQRDLHRRGLGLRRRALAARARGRRRPRRRPLRVRLPLGCALRRRPLARLRPRRRGRRPPHRDHDRRGRRQQRHPHRAGDRRRRHRARHRRVPVSGRSVSVLVSDAGSGLAGGTIEVRDDADSRFTPLEDDPARRAPDRPPSALDLDVPAGHPASPSPTAPATPSAPS